VHNPAVGVCQSAAWGYTEPMQPGVSSGGPLARAVAWTVHFYTASGAVLGFLALQAAFAGDHRTCFIMLGAALAVDSTDGTLARAANVKHVLPWFDGAMLDNLVDYLNYVIVPVAVFMQPGMLPDEFRLVPLVVLMASAYGFSRADAKGVVEHYFLGFPSYWNIMAFYFVVLGTGPMMNLLVLVTALVLVFVPLRWLYPSRSEILRRRTLGLGVVWAAMGLVLVLRLPEVQPLLGTVSLFYPLYYIAASLVYHRQG